jgi:hypothetical protein
MSTSIVVLKDKTQTYQPLLLAEFTFSDGTMLYLCTHNLNTAGGGFQYNGNDYLARIVSHDVQPIGASQQGISMPASASVTIADDDALIYQNYELTKGFGGAQLLLRFVLWNVGTSTYSSDCSFPFVGTCSQPSGSDTSIHVQALSLVNMTGTKFPTTLIQRVCPWQFPTTLAQRQDGADNPDSWYYQCGYSPDCTGSNKCGNYSSGTTPFTACGYTKDNCVARGMYTIDSTSRKTGRFGGFQWDPPAYVRSEGYIDSGWIDIFSDPNVAKYGQPIPMVYGTQWVQGLVLHTEGDANSTRAEVILCSGRVTSVVQLLCNGETIPAANTVDGISYGVADALFHYNIVNNGDRTGAPCADKGFDSHGDPFGSTCVVEVVVPRSLVASPSSPNVQALITGPKLVCYTGITHIIVSGGVATATLASNITADGSFNSGFQINITGNANSALNTVWQIAGVGWSGTSLTWTATGVADGTYAGGYVRYHAFTASPVWILYDLLSWAGFDSASLDIGTFVTAAAYCSTVITYTKANGSTGSHPRYELGWAVTQQKTLGEAVRDCLASFAGMMSPSPTTGLLELRIKQTLADQQPSVVVGSNYITPITSVHVDGTAGSGYAAYLFDVSSILRQDKKAQVTLVPRANSDLQNSYSIAFQDSENAYVTDTYQVTDSVAVQRMGQLLNGTMPGLPPTTYDQAMRVANQMLGEALRCNARLDPSGSTRVEITTTFKAVHLKYGDIVLLSWDRKSFNSQMFRVISIQPSTNWETAKIILQWHEDDVWTDAYGQGDIPAVRTAYPNRSYATPYPPLLGRGWDPTTGVDALRPDEHGFYATWSDAAWATSTNRTARFWCFPTINSFSTIAPPKIPITGASVSTGGVLASGQSYWAWICSEDTNGLLTMPSVIRVDVPTGTSTNSFVIADPVWDAGSVAYHVWISDTPARPYYYGRTTGSPSSITLTSGLASASHNQIPVPDPALAGIRLKMKRILVAGAWEGFVTAATSLTLVCTGAGWATNEWAGRIVTMVGRADPVARIDMPPDNSWLVASNTSDTLTLTSGGADPSALFGGSYTQCYIVVRCQASSASTTTIADSTLAMTVGTQQGRHIRIIKGTGVGQTSTVASNTATTFTVTPPWNTTPDTTSVFWVEEPAWLSQTDYRIKNDRWDYALTIFAVQYAFDITGLAKTHLLFQPLGINPTGRETIEDLAYPAISDLYYMLDVITETVGTAAPKLNGIALWVNGNLELNPDATNQLTMPSTQVLAPTGAVATLKGGPSGSSLVAVVKVNTITWLTFTFPPGVTSVTLSSATVLAAGSVPASGVVSLAITNVGSTTPGNDLSISIYV